MQSSIFKEGRGRGGLFTAHNPPLTQLLYCIGCLSTIHLWPFLHWWNRARFEPVYLLIWQCWHNFRHFKYIFYTEFTFFVFKNSFKERNIQKVCLLWCNISPNAYEKYNVYKIFQRMQQSKYMILSIDLNSIQWCIKLFIWLQMKVRCNITI